MGAAGSIARAPTIIIPEGLPWSYVLVEWPPGGGQWIEFLYVEVDGEVWWAWSMLYEDF